MNISETLNFSQERPAVASIIKTDKVNYLAIGLLKNQKLEKHEANYPTFLTVLKGEVRFMIQGEEFLLQENDVHEIPVYVEHELIGLKDKNIVTLIQEK